MISVAVTTYNGEKYIEEQLCSICKQTMPVDEIIIVDDLSTDRTVAVIKDFIQTNKENRIHLFVNKKNLGYTENFYKAISKTRGDYIFLSDQDDLWKENKVERMVNVIKDTDSEILCSNFEIIDEKGIPTKKEFRIPGYIRNAQEGFSEVGLKMLMLENVAQGCTYCFTNKVRDIYLRIHYTEIIHDHQLMVIGAAVGKAGFLNEKLIDYRIHSSNAIGFTDRKKIRGIDFRIRHKEPRMVTLLKRIRKYYRVPSFYQCALIHYLRIPIIRVVFKRFFGK